MAKQINKQTISGIQDGYTVTWNRDQEGELSSADAGRFYIDGAKALEIFKGKDPRGNYEARDFVKSFKQGGKVASIAFLSAVIGAIGLMVLVAALIFWKPEPRTQPAGERDVLTAAPPTVEEAAKTDEEIKAAEEPAVALEPELAPDAEGLDKARQRISHEVFDYLVQHTEVTVGTPEYHTNANGTNEVQVPIAWQVDPAPVLAVLDRYFWDVERAPLRHTKVDFSNYSNDPVVGLVINRHFNEKKDRKVPYADELIDWLSTQQVGIVLTVDGRSSAVTMASGRSCLPLQCKGPGRDQYQFQFLNDPNGVVLFSNTKTEQNPVVIPDVPPSVRDELGKVEWKVQLRSKDDPRYER